MSPERIRGDAYTTAADVWGLGSRCWRASASAVRRLAVKRRITRTSRATARGRGRRGARSITPGGLVRACQKLFEACLAKDAVERPTADELLVMDSPRRRRRPSSRSRPTTPRDGRNELNVCGRTTKSSCRRTSTSTRRRLDGGLGAPRRSAASAAMERARGSRLRRGSRNSRGSSTTARRTTSRTPCAHRDLAGGGRAARTGG